MNDPTSEPEVKVSLSGTSEPLLPKPQLGRTCGGFCCPKCGKPFAVSHHEYVCNDGTEVSGVYHTPACECRVPIWWTPEVQP